ncbi:hypothetical protein M3Y97_00680900 [Aphelenchoides bicaudatus]|nr:hypothetical protein M3Y97_00680900 [Aphelenchoides bicaudatus]
MATAQVEKPSPANFDQIVGLNSTTSLNDLERICRESGQVIRNYSITSPHENESSTTDIAAKSAPHLRPVDFVFAEMALPHLHIITPEYFSTSIEETFNWTEMAERLGAEWEGDWFIVAFRSVRKATACSEALYQADEKAHQEAIESGGLLKYWYGTLNEHRQCLAMCIWSSREFARLAIVKPLHLKAVSLTRQMYESYTLERYSLIKKRGECVFHIERL